MNTEAGFVTACLFSLAPSEVSVSRLGDFAETLILLAQEHRLICIVDSGSGDKQAMELAIVTQSNSLGRSVRRLRNNRSASRAWCSYRVREHADRTGNRICKDHNHSGRSSGGCLRLPELVSGELCRSPRLGIIELHQHRYLCASRPRRMWSGGSISLHRAMLTARLCRHGSTGGTAARGGMIGTTLGMMAVATGTTTGGIPAHVLASASSSAARA